MPRASLPAGRTSSTPRQTATRAAHTTQKRQARGRDSRPEPGSPLASSPDPLAGSPVIQIERSSRTRRKTLAGDNAGDETAAVGKGAEVDKEPTDEQKLEAWQDFAQEHYEMVEQLPLELHRNFRLLRELDDGCVDQTGKLQAQIRAYIAARLALVQKFAVVASAIQAGTDDNSAATAISAENEGKKSLIEAPPAPPVPDASRAEQDLRGASLDPDPDKEKLPSMAGDRIQEGPIQNAGISESTADPEMVAAAEATPVPTPPPMPELPADMGDPQPDGEGGLVVSSTEQMPEVPHRQAFPQSDASPLAGAGEAKERVAASPSTDYGGVAREDPSLADTEKVAPSAVAQIQPSELPANLLPEIGRLSREIVRNCEEKVALAVGAYNSIDRHIRALDSALSAQETSLILGLRPDTLPSSGVDQTMDQSGDNGAIGGEAGEEEGMVLGIGGGGAAVGGRKKKKGRKGRREVVQEEVPLVQEVIMNPASEGMNDDPNEPVYCYCQRVSFGTMIACENDDCPLEWFHLPCTGLQVEPQGSWWCERCKPKIGLGMGGAGQVQPGSFKKRKR